MAKEISVAAGGYFCGNWYSKKFFVSVFLSLTFRKKNPGSSSMNFFKFFFSLETYFTKSVTLHKSFPFKR
jgi:hypothetical protein